MRTIHSRIAGLQQCAAQIAIAGCVWFATTQASAQASANSNGNVSAAPTPAAYKGCVQKAPGLDGVLLIGTPNACARLTGKAVGDDAIGHEVQLEGILTPRTASVSASLEVDSVISVGNACSKVCTLRPRRGLPSPQGQQKATPGTEGGTPGKVGPPE